MARAFLTPPRLPSGATLPATGEAGALFFKSDEEKIYVHDGTQWVVAQGGGGGGGGVVVSDTVPLEPEVGTYWFDSSTTKSYIYYDNFWIEVGYSGSGYIISETAPSNPSEGDVWFSTSEGVIYVYYDDFWIDPSTGGAAGVPVGGTTGQVLTKVSDNDYDSNWSALTTSDITGVTATAAELNILGGATVTTTELNILDGVTTTAAALNTIDDGTAGFTALSNGTAGISYQPVSHNYVINGAVDVWQRGDSFSGATLPDNVYTADRYTFRYNGTGATYSATKTAFTPDEVNAIGFGDALQYIKLECTVAPTGQTFHSLQNIIEDVRTLAGQVVTFSFWAKASSAFTSAIQVGQVFGSGGSSQNFTFFGNASITTSWQRFSLTATLPDMSGKTIAANSYIRPLINLPFNATYEIDTWGWQLEAGSVATPFKRHAPSLALEKEACKWYYEQQGYGDFHWITTAHCTSTTGALAVLTFTEKRATPSVSLSGNALGIYNATGTRLTTTASSFSNIRNTSCRMSLTVASGLVAGDAGMVVSRNGSFIINAELT